MDPRERTIEWLRSRPHSRWLSAVPSLVYAFYADHILECETPAPRPISDAIMRQVRIRDLSAPHANTTTVVTYATALLTTLLPPIAREGDFDIRILFDVRLYCFVVPEPLPINGQMQFAFRVNGEVRGVAAVGKAPLKALTARCLIGMEFLATKLQFAGPVFGIAFTRDAWSIVEMPVHYAHDEIAGDRRIHRFHGSYDSNQKADMELFLGTLHAVVSRAASFSTAT